MSNMYGRKVVAYKVNKSGGSVIAGDVLVPDTTNDNAFTTTTSAAVTTGAWVADETIASNATGRVVLSGHVTLINVSASVTRGHTGTTHTVAKQAVSTGGTARTAGTFCKFTTGGTTPEADIWPVDLGAGSGLTDPMTTRGDIIVRDSSNTTARLAIGATAGMVVGKTGSDVAYFLPPGYEYDYVQITSPVSVTATVEASATTVITGSAITYDGSTVVMVEFYSPSAYSLNSAGVDMYAYLFDGSTSLGLIASMRSETANRALHGLNGRRRLTPSNAAHTYSIRAIMSSAGTGNVDAGAGGAGNSVPAFIRITKV